MSTDIWFPFYYGDYLKDTMQLTAERHGIYLLLMIHCWQNGFIEDDEDSLTMIAKVDYQKIKYILDKYFKNESGKYYQKRITKERKVAEENKKKRSEKARKAANARWNEDATSNATSMPEAMLQGMPKRCPSSSPSSSQSNSPKPSGNKVPKHKHGEYLNVLLTDSELGKLKSDYGESETGKMIKNLDEYIEMKGAKYKNHNLTMRKWAGAPKESIDDKIKRVQDKMKAEGKI